MGYREEWKMLHVLNTSKILNLYDPGKNNKIPADKVDVHYSEYSQSNLPESKESLKNELQKIINRYKLFATPKFCNP
jgi:hypothetical protein